MGTWFQKRRRLFPDARLDLSNAGISVSFGIRHAPVMDGEDHAEALDHERNSTGTRIYRRERPDTLSSNNLITLADLACEVETRRAGIARAIGTCRRRIAWARIWLRIGRFLASTSLFAASRLAALQAALANLEKTETDLTALLDTAVIDVDFAVTDEVRSAYLKMVDAFRGMARAERIWHASPGFNPKRYQSRATASRALDLKPVRFAVESLPLFRSEWPAMHFGDVNGVEFFLLPGVMALRRPGLGLALVEMKDLSIEFSPRDAIVAKQWLWDSVRVKPVSSWLDDDGPRDRQMQYGDIEIASETGLYDRFVVSDWRAVQAFRHALTAFRKSVSHEPGRARESAAVPYDEIPDLRLPLTPRVPWVIRPAIAIGMATAVVCCVVVGVGFGFRTPTSSPAAPAVEAALSEPSVSGPSASPAPALPTPAPVETAETPPSTPVPAPAAPSPAAVAMNPPPEAPPPATPPPVATEDVTPAKPAAETSAPVPATPEPDAAPPPPAAAVTEAKPEPETSTPAPATPSPEEAVAGMPDIVTGAGPAAAPGTATAEPAPEESSAVPAAPPPASAVAEETEAKPATEPLTPVLAPSSAEAVPAATPKTATADTAPEPPNTAPAAPNEVKSTPDQVAMNNLIASLTAETPTLTSADSAPAEPAPAKPASPSEKNSEKKTAAANTQSPSGRSLTEAEVTELQSKLYDLGYYSGGADGHLDEGTVEAFNAWRSETGRSAVRTVGRADYRAFLTAISR